MRNNPKLRWFPYAGGVILLALGLVLILWPEVVITVFPPLIGTVMIFLGAQGLASVLFLRGKLREPGLKLVQGFVNIIVGAVFLSKRDVSLAFMAILFGLYAMVSSGISVSEALGDWKNDRRQAVTGLAEGAFGFVLGGIILFAPFSSRAPWSQVLGAYFLLMAAGSFYWAYKITHRQPEGQSTSEEARPAEPDEEKEPPI